MKKESKNVACSIYCKQRSVEHWYQCLWACGPSSFVTAARLLGDRNLPLNRVIRKIGLQSARQGINGEQLSRVAKAFGYRTIPFPDSKAFFYEEFKAWLISMWAKGYPTVVSADDGGHFICAYSNPEDDGVWYMDPMEEAEVFSFMSWSQFLDYSSQPDDDDEYQFWDAYAIAPSARMTHVVPPSTALFEWINGLDGDDDLVDEVATSFVDGYSDAVDRFRVQGEGGKVSLASLLAEDGPVYRTLEEWEAYYTSSEMKRARALLEVLEDMSLYSGASVSHSRRAEAVLALSILLMQTLRHWEMALK